MVGVGEEETTTGGRGEPATARPTGLTVPVTGA